MTDHVSACEIYIKEEPWEEDSQNECVASANAYGGDEIKQEMAEIIPSACYDVNSHNDNDVMAKKEISEDEADDHIHVKQEEELIITEQDDHLIHNNVLNRKLPVLNDFQHIKENHCPHCDHKSASLASLKSHIKARHTAEKIHQCPHCNHSAVSALALKSHVTKDHPDKKRYHCPRCYYRAVSASKTKKSIRIRHNFQKPPHSLSTL